MLQLYYNLLIIGINTWVKRFVFCMNSFLHERYNILIWLDVSFYYPFSRFLFWLILARRQRQMDFLLPSYDKSTSTLELVRVSFMETLHAEVEKSIIRFSTRFSSFYCYICAFVYGMPVVCHFGNDFYFSSRCVHFIIHFPIPFC